MLVVHLIFPSWLQKQSWSSQKRQKLFKIANKNKDGWLVVQEYETDDLASDSEDQKKIRKAKPAAEKKRKEVKSNIGKNLSVLVICSFFAIRPPFMFTLWSSWSF